MDNMEIYEQVRKVPESAQKTIGGGRLKGFTDINAMWRIETLTRLFGICGIGWKYEITQQWLETGANGEISGFTNINLYIKVEGEWSEAIPGTGGSSFVANEKAGAYTSDEVYKMSLTDALSIACKALGVGADIYYSTDRTKYSNSGNGSGKNYGNGAQGKPKQPMTPTEAADTVLNFGRHSGKSLRQLVKEKELDYLSWLQGDKCSNEYIKNAVNIMMAAAKKKPDEPEYEQFSQVDINSDELPF